MNSKIPKISVIIPVYNVGDLLYKCVESVKNQILDNIEIILIDDGSTDNSGQICEKICEKYKGIRVIHKVNEGVSVARNLGIQIAEGEYIGFVDADDYLDKTMYSKMYTQAKTQNSDIVMCDVNIEYENRIEVDTINLLNESTRLEVNSIYPELLMEMAGSMWKCIYKKELLIKNNILCPVGLKLSEDRIFNILAFGYAKNIYYLKEPLYIQKVRSNSATRKYYPNMLEIALNSREKIFNALDQSWCNSEEYKKIYEKQNIGCIFQCIINEFHTSCKKNIYEKYKSIKSIITNLHVKEIVSNIDKKNIKIKLIQKELAVITTVIYFIKCKK